MDRLLQKKATCGAESVRVRVREERMLASSWAVDAEHVLRVF